MHLFWRKGYDNTSIADLEEASGLKRPSLYNAFDNKRELFKKVLKTYNDYIEGQLSLVLNEGTIESLKNIFRVFTYEDFSPHLSQNFGCLIVNTSIESINDDASIKPFVKQYEQMFFSKFSAILKRAKKSKVLRHDLDPDKLAKFLMTFLFGLLLRVRFYNSIPAMKEPALAIIDIIHSWTESSNKRWSLNIV